MPPLLFKEMKGASFSCVSPASAAVCTSIDRRSMVRPTIVGRSTDRRLPQPRDPRRSTSSKPKPYSDKSRKSLDRRLSTRTSTITSTSDLISPASSSRFLLDDTAFFDVFPEPTDCKPKPSSSSSRSRLDQVVVLRVSLHCKGCEGKVRKHISKMEGVTSFNIDFAAKKVTVKGDVTPLGVLSSVSKVKNAQFWPSPPRASASF